MPVAGSGQNDNAILDTDPVRVRYALGPAARELREVARSPQLREVRTSHTHVTEVARRHCVCVVVLALPVRLRTASKPTSLANCQRECHVVSVTDQSASD